MYSHTNTNEKRRETKERKGKGGRIGKWGGRGGCMYIHSTRDTKKNSTKTLLARIEVFLLLEATIKGLAVAVRLPLDLNCLLLLLATLLDLLLDDLCFAT